MIRLGGAEGLAILGTSAAFPRDLDPACPELDTPAAVAALGATMPEGAGSWGVDRRQWLALPGVRPTHDVEALALLAADGAITAAGLRPADIDLLYLATSTPTSISASLAARVGRRLGVVGGCVDVRAGGGGALHAWLAAVGMVRLGARAAVVVAAEAPSGFLAPGDPTGALYGDGAGAFVVGPGTGGLVGAVMATVAAPGRPFTVPGPLPPVADGVYTFQRPDRTYTEAVRGCWQTTVAALRSVAAVDRFVPYAVTAAQLAEVGAAAGLPASSVLDRHGCLGAAGIPVALHSLGFGGTTSTAAVAGGVGCVGLVWRSANV